jgi:DNA repair photolyase
LNAVPKAFCSAISAILAPAPASCYYSFVQYNSTVLRRLPVQNPSPRFAEHITEYEGCEVRTQGLELIRDESRSILSENSSPDLPFRFSLNAYRGCAHGCSYCYARPSHEYLSLGAGTDFERKLVFKPNAPDLLRKRFDHPSWRGALIVISGNTDAYQPIEAKLELTRRCLEVCLDYANPVHIITKASLVERDIDLLAKLHRQASVGISISVTSLDEHVSRLLEPYAPTPLRRIETIRRLAEQHLPVVVHVAPWIPGLTDHDMVPILEAARAAGALSAMAQPVRLPGATEQVFIERLQRDFPLQATKVLTRSRELRSGKLNDTRFHSRMRGEGSYAGTVNQVFGATCRRLGFQPMPKEQKATFRRPAPHSPLRAQQQAPSAPESAQLSLFAAIT